MQLLKNKKWRDCSVKICQSVRLPLGLRRGWQNDTLGEEVPKWVIIILFSWISYFSYGQSYYEHPINGVHDQWHRVDLPVEAFGRLQNSYASIRVFGKNKNGDKIEQPYLLIKEQPRTIMHPVPSTIINRTRKGNDYFFTFEISDEPMLSQINLDFGNDDFDWEILLEGSIDQKEWFTIIEDYRILDIPGKYRFTRLDFDAVNYPFLRIKINAKEKPLLNAVTINSASVTTGEYENWSPEIISHQPISNTKNSALIIDLKKTVPVSYLKIKPSVAYDYYRNFSMSFLKDSLKTETGWRERWSSAGSGTLSSFGNNVFPINENLTSKIKVIIKNQDNQILDIPAVEVKGAKHYLLVRFDGKPPYSLEYGNSKLNYPNYDLVSFKKNIPEKPSTVKIEKAIYQKRIDEEKNTPLFTNSIWLYLLMGLIILVLGGFTMSMIKNTKEK